MVLPKLSVRNLVRCLTFFLVIAGVIFHSPPNYVQLTDVNLSPFQTWGHIFGCDRLGRDNFALFSYGALATVILCVPAKALTLIFASLFSFLSYVGEGRFSILIESLFSVFLSLPSLLVALIIIGVFPETKLTIILAIVLSDWAMNYESLQAKIREVKGSGYVSAALAMGGKSNQIFLLHFLPALRILIEYLFLTGIPSVIMTTALFSYLGLDTSFFDWGPGLGEQISFSKDYFEKTPVSVIFPILGIIGLVYSFGRSEN
ncbi:ABC transporter permease [Leptospira ilyithenensis]|uniref:ABC transporter permease subunit n=1 Tax=Leptospira ilyithenensis TaxID=2484901 RepID=A0A4R9LWD7_9LEPT|nr:ABC transporter permease subunit [Leptospira ilyithenensis]TGN14360.1 ABC transporter permease subunit [Leptospira ilyithenensis]